MQKTFYSYSFGCRVNQAEKEELDRQMVDRGYSFDENDPSLYIINTCSVTHKAEREAKQMIYQVKREKPNTKIIITGCAATNWIKTKTTLKEVDLIVDNQSKEYIATIIENRIGQDLTKSMTPTVLKDKFLDSGRIIFKLQDGCQRFCTYCIVPYLRGLPKSTPIIDIVSKINQFPDMKEVLLTAINTEAYGYDTKESFISLLEAIFDQTTAPRLSFGSIHPWSVNDEFFTFYRKYAPQKRLVNFFHVPLQSGSNKMLGLMKRGYTREEFLEKLDILAKIEPFTFIGTDVIAGFLEETDKDFQDTYNFMEQTPISKFHVFRYSKREHTAAFYLGKRLQEPTPLQKATRSRALADLGKRKYEQFLSSHVGHTFSTLILEKRLHNLQSGLLSNQIPVQVISDIDRTGELKNVKILEYKNEALFGKIV